MNELSIETIIDLYEIGISFYINDGEIVKLVILENTFTI